MTTVLGAAAARPVPPLPVPALSCPDLATCLEQRRLSVDGRPLDPAPEDVDALRVAERVLVAGRKAVVVPNDPRTPLGPLIAASAHVHALVAEHSAGRPFRSPLRVGVVTRDLRSRSLYRSLRVSARPGPRGELLREFVPATTVGADGSLVGSGGGWSTVFAESGREVAELSLDLVVVETPVADPKVLDRLSCPVVVVARDPADPTAATALSQWPGFAYFKGNRSVDVVPVRDEVVCREAGLFWQDAAGLLRAASNSGLGNRLLREAFSLFYDLTGLAVPGMVFEAAAGVSFASRINTLGRTAHILHGEVRDLWLPMVEVELAALLRAVTTKASAKSTALLRVLDEAVARRETVLIVARTTAQAVAVREYLALGLPGVRVGTIATLDEEAPADRLILLGALPSWARWVYRSRNIERVSVLTWTGGDWDEAKRVTDAVSLQQALVAAVSGDDRRARSWQALTQDEGYALPPLKINLAGTAVAIQALPPPPEAPPGMYSGGAWVAPIEPPPGDRATPGGLPTITDAVLVRFEDGMSTWLSARGTAHRWGAASGCTQECPVGDLRPGDTLVLLDGDAAKGLLEKVLEAADRVPELAVAAAWHLHWRRALRRAHALAGSYAALGTELRNRGCAVQDQTVRLWCVGEVVGPIDPHDVHRVGKYLSDDVLSRSYVHVHAAIRTIRNAHVRLGMRLARLARATGPDAGAAEQVLDPATGLTAADLEHSVTLHRVATLTAHQAVPRLALGVLLDPTASVSLPAKSDEGPRS